MVQSKFVTQFDFVCTNHLHCLACACEMIMKCSWTNLLFHRSPIFGFPHIPLVPMHGTNEHALGSSFFPLLSFFIIIMDTMGQAWVLIKKEALISLMFSLYLNWIENSWIEFENKDIKWSPNHLGNKID